MILNAGNRPLSIENIPLDDIEKTFENDDVGCSSNSQLVADAPPEKSTLGRAFFNEVFLSAREVMLRIVKLLRSEVSA